MVEIAENSWVIPALGHEWGEWEVVTPATETAEGLEQRTCARCGEVETRAIPAGVAYRYIGSESVSWTKGSDKDLSFTFKRSIADETTFGHFIGITVDGEAVPEKDASGKVNYTAESGSLVLKLQPSFLETLSTGGHKVEAIFDDGSATAAFAVKPAPSKEKEQEEKEQEEGSSDAGDAVKRAEKAAAPKTSGAASRLAKTGDAVPAAAIAATGMVAALALALLLAARRRRA